MAFLVFLALEWNGIPGQDRDSAAYYRAGELARSGGAIYDPVPPPGPHEFAGTWHYLYPPPLAALLATAPRASYRTFDRAWLLLNAIAFWVFAGTLGKLWNGRWSMASTARWGAALWFMPGTLLAIHFGNIELMILALVALSLAFPKGAGAVLGLAALIKVAPVWPLLILAMRQPRQVIAGALVALAVSTGLCVLVLGPAPTMIAGLQWIRDIMPTVGQGQFWGESLARLQQGDLHPRHYVGNLSITFAPIQLAVMTDWWRYDGGPLPLVLRAYLATTSLAVPLLIAWYTRHRSPEYQAAAAYAGALLAAAIVRPYALPVILLVLASSRGGRRDVGRFPEPVISEPHSVVKTARA